jgi:hypothetical protein
MKSETSSNVVTVRGTRRLHVGVVGDDLHAERGHPLRDERADAAQTHDTEGLLGQLDAGVLAPLPLAVLESGVGLRDVARGGEQETAGQLSRGHDVRGGGVDDHHAGLGGGGDVDVVEADAGSCDDLQFARGGYGLRVDLGGRTDQDRVDVGDGRKQFGAVGAVAVPDLEVGAKRVDGGGRQLFSDEYDRFRAHVSPHMSNADGRPDGRMRWRGASRVEDARRCGPDAYVVRQSSAAPEVVLRLRGRITRTGEIRLRQPPQPDRDVRRPRR